MRIRPSLLLCALMAACDLGSGRESDASLDTDQTADMEVVEDVGRLDIGVRTPLDGGFTRDLGARDAQRVADANIDTEPFVPEHAFVQSVFSGPSAVPTPSSWNAHLPRLAGDSQFLYTIHTHYPPEIGARFAAILRRPLDGGDWLEVGRILYPHQPPGIVMDTRSQLHLVFDCLRPASSDVQCFVGGAGTQSRASRFYHLVFSARAADGGLRFDTYANRNEWSGESNGYHGIGTTADGWTVWSLANPSWGRVVQWHDGASNVGTITTLEAPGASNFLYPIMGALPSGSDSLVMYVGEFDPTGGTNAGYLASTAFAGNLSSLTPLFRRVPSETPAPGTVGAYPSDLAVDRMGVLFALAFHPSPQCTELLRFDSGLANPPTVIPVGCHAGYAKLQFNRAGMLYMIEPGLGATFHVGVSGDRGQTWSFTNVDFERPSGVDVSFAGFNLVKSFTSPDLFEPDLMRFSFAGVGADGHAQHSYYGEIALTPSD